MIKNKLLEVVKRTAEMQSAAKKAAKAAKKTSETSSKSKPAASS